MRPARRRAPVPLFALVALMLSVAVVADTSAALAGARRGLGLWWTAVLPGLLPFFILSDLLQNLGVVRALGVLLEPVMRPLFNLPGAAGFAVALGFTSGQPGGVRAATRLVAEGLCTPEEGARLASFANAAGPLFVTGVTAVSLFGAPEAAPHLVIAHYGAALLAGMLMGHLPPAVRRAPHAGTPAHPTRLRPRVRALPEAWKQLEEAAGKSPPVGTLLGNAVRQGVELILLVGGFIVLFSVVLGVVEACGLDRWLAAPLAWVLRRVGLPGSLASAAVAGFLEVTAGVSRAAEATGPLGARLTAAAAILAWSGLSIHAQAAALLATARLSYRRFLQGRLIQLVLSPLLYLGISALFPGGSARPTLALPLGRVTGPLGLLSWSLAAFAFCLGGLLTLSAFCALWQLATALLRRRVALIWFPPGLRRGRP